VRVLIVSWEFPPLIVGGLGRHVAALGRELDVLGHEVCVLTRGTGPEPIEERAGTLRVIRAAFDPLAVNFDSESVLAWGRSLEHSLIRAGLAS
jgi:glycogen(starch) synthase